MKKPGEGEGLSNGLLTLGGLLFLAAGFFTATLMAFRVGPGWGRASFFFFIWLWATTQLALVGHRRRLLVRSGLFLLVGLLILCWGLLLSSFIDDGVMGGPPRKWYEKYGDQVEGR